jgi:hypothetical protein
LYLLSPTGQLWRARRPSAPPNRQR